LDFEKFVWLESVTVTPHSLQLASGPGYVAIKPQPDAYATVKELLADPSKGWLMSATALLSLRVGEEVRYPMMLRDAGAPVSPNCWQIPAGRCDQEELPLATACRELAEELGVSGEVTDWSDVAIRMGGPEVTYLTATGIHWFKGRCAVHGNTLEFYYPMELSVSSFDSIQLFDKEPYERPVKLFTWEEILAMHDADKLAAGTAAVVAELR
jgi:8-oxo-dGTP pyrophosphatase MutT (NUDIX family)